MPVKCSGKWFRFIPFYCAAWLKVSVIFACTEDMWQLIFQRISCKAWYLCNEVCLQYTSVTLAYMVFTVPLNTKTKITNMHKTKSIVKTSKLGGHLIYRQLNLRASSWGDT